MRMKLPVLVVVGSLALVGHATAAAADWTTIKGRFVFGGEAPPAADLKVDKDIEVCGKHKLVAEELVVGADKGIANVVVFVRDKDVKVKPGAEAPAAAVLDNTGCRFQPHVVFVQTGQELVVKNSDTVGHNSNIATVKNPPSNNLIPAGGETTVKFAADEAIPAQVTCNIHPWMKAYAVFRKDGYVAVSAADGSFTIADLPAGEPIEFQVWHERVGGVGLSRPDLKWSGKGRFTVTIEEGQTRDLGTLELPAGSLGS